MNDLILDATEVFGTDLAFALLHPDDPEYGGRDRIRRFVLDLEPHRETSRPPRRGPVTSGITWKLVARDGVTTAIRARDFSGLDDALRDMRAFIGRTLREVRVSDPTGEANSFWIVHRREIVMVSARVLAPRRRRALDREASRVIETLHRGPSEGG